MTNLLFEYVLKRKGTKNGQEIGLKGLLSLTIYLSNVIIQEKSCM
jgi:hypothetical protein